MSKFIFVTGGVVSGLGKGITAASLGRLLKQRGCKVTIQKFDPYINVDPGTMSPFQHGEVFVTDDGAETDLDLGHYERFVDENLSVHYLDAVTVDDNGEDMDYYRFDVRLNHDGTSSHADYFYVSRTGHAIYDSQSFSELFHIS